MSGLPSREVALRWLHEAADGLDAAHAAGVVHRDVKPANLLLDERDRVAVGDFGIATAAWAASVTTTGLVVGTMAYLAPEQRSGRPATAESDRYALGVVAHELLTGARPVEAGIDPTLPDAAQRALEQALAADPHDRPSSCRALIADLERALGDADERTTVQPTVAAPYRSDATPDAPVHEPTAVSQREPVAAPVHRRPPTPPPSATVSPGPSSRGGTPPRRRVPPALVLLGLMALIAGVAAAAFSGGSEAPQPRADTTSTARRTATTTQPAASTPTPTPAAAATPAATPANDAKAANDAGFELFKQGRYEEALPLLQQAVSGLEATPDDIYYAYALFNVGATLRRLGRPAEAIPYLERRLEVSDFKRDVVEAELKDARKDAKRSEKTSKKGKKDDSDDG